MSEHDDPIHSGATRVVPPAAGASDDAAGQTNLLQPGTRLGEFEITGLIGEGGFGIVYAAYDHLLEREVAIKEYMPSALASRVQGGLVAVKSARHEETFEAGRRSFVNEAKLLAQFDHPALVKVYRFWEANGTAYMVMPYYRGKTLRGALKELGAAPSEAWLRRMLAPLCDALETIHAQQCFHRDIAPDNILILPDGRPLLLDFGAARRVIGDITQALTVILKPGYAPLEQYGSGPEMRQGPWTDVYALAAVVYYCITGRAPVPSVSRLMKDTLVPAREAGRGICDERFLAAVDHALAVAIDDRTASVRQFLCEIGSSPDGDSRPGAQPGRDEDFEVTHVLPRTFAIPATQGGAGAAGAPPSAGTAREPRKIDRSTVAIALGLAAAIAIAAWVLLSGDKPPPAPSPASVQASAPGTTSATASAPAAATSTAAATPSRPDAGSPSGATPTGPTPSAAATGAQAPTPAAVPAPAPSSAAAPSPATPAPPPAFSTDTVLDTVFAERDPTWSVQIDTGQRTLRIGQDKLRFGVRSERTGYL
ncbi:MAG: serine/threonine protein kinase, partial [Burkholderiaceae bacterium]|nr:serine/threonine protein kinase [Burkholderiaceae bacterium]